MLPLRHVVKNGECIESIAAEYGFFPATLWEHSGNLGLRQLRQNPHVLRPGDELYIPEQRQRSENAATGRTYLFRRRGIPARFRVVLERNGVPRAEVTYTLTVGDATIEGKTGADGLVMHFIPPDAPFADLRTADGEWIRLNFGQLLPVSDFEGVRARLANLGYSAALREDDEDQEDVVRRVGFALRKFQRRNGLAVTGLADEATAKKLVDIHGS